MAKGVEMPTLSDLAVGQSARIVGYQSGDSPYRAKLLAMGLTPKARVRLVRVAPLGDPLELDLRGFRLSVRRHEAAVVLVAIEEEGARSDE